MGHVRDGRITEVSSGPLRVRAMALPGSIGSPSTNIPSIVPVQPPPLENGDRLTRDEFERRYQAMPHLKKAELIEGEVYVPSPVHWQRHATPHPSLITWMGTYQASTPGVAVGDNGTVRLDATNEPQPDG